jgi:choline dehydrogenase-like flavoprotein
VIDDNLNTCDPSAKTPDVIVVGAGAVGIVLAIELTRQGRRVTVIEGGPAQPRADYQQANAAACTGMPHDGLTAGRMKALGGTTRLWGGQLVPFSQGDLAPDTYPGKRGWPIAHAELAGATARVFDLLGVPDDARDTLAIYHAATGRVARLDDKLEVAVTAWLPQPDFARLFARELAELPGLTVLTGHEVIDMSFARHGVVERVVARGPGGADVHLRASQVVLANGTFEIARLLLTLARDHPDCGFAENRHIGRGFIDHLHGVVGRFETIDRRRVAALLDPIHRRGRKYAVKLRLGPGYQREAGLCNVAGMVLAPIGLRELVSDLRRLGRRLFAGQASFAGLRAGCRQLLVLAPLIWRYLVHRRAGGVLRAGALLGVEVEQIACPESCIGLDPDNPARIALHWAFDGGEMQAIRAFALAVRDRFAADGLGRLVIDPLVEAGDSTFLAACSDGYHQMGGARMATRAEDGVVDPQSRVFGTANLYVAGAATFPSGSFANPTLTAMALALRLADHLAQCA